MPYGKIYVDELENSTSGVIDLAQVTSNDATTSQKGYMSAADKTKLDGVEAGAEVNVVNNIDISALPVLPSS